MANEKILVINPGSTSTKVALFDGNTEVWKVSIDHDRESLKPFNDVVDQLDFRYDLIVEEMTKHGARKEDLACVMSRGGPIAAVRSGPYEVNDTMVEIARTHPQDHHVSIIGAMIAYKLAQEVGIKAYIYDAVSVDELLDICHVTGLPNITRVGQGHHLNMRAAALKYCKDNNLDYYNSTLLVAHLGGGISTSLQMHGRIVDMSNDEDGPFAPERAGCMPMKPFLDLCFDHGYTKQQVYKMMKGNAGLVAWLGTNDSREVEKMIKAGDEKAKLVYEAMAYNTSRHLAKLTPGCKGKVDQIILTGGIAYSEYFTGMIKEQVDWIAPVTVIPGENEMQALADGAARVLRGEEQARLLEG